MSFNLGLKQEGESMVIKLPDNSESKETTIELRERAHEPTDLEAIIT